MISFTSETIFFLGIFPVTNALLTTLFVDMILVFGAILIYKNMSLIPGFFQLIAETMLDTLYSLTESIAQSRAKQIFPYFITFFLFILISNLTGLLPGVASIGFFDHEKLIPLFRSPTSDLNTTLALALVSLTATHILSIRSLGIKEYLSRYISLSPIALYVGLLEIISEFTKIVSLSFRLFGNIFAGEIVLSTISKMFAFVFPLPFLFLEVIVGFVQALVFSMLTMVFMAILTTPHNTAHSEGR